MRMNKLSNAVWFVSGNYLIKIIMLSALLSSPGQIRASYDYPVWEVSPEPQLQLSDPTGPPNICAGLGEAVKFSLPHDGDKDTWVWWDAYGNKHGAVYYAGNYRITWSISGSREEGFDLNYKIPGSGTLPGVPNYGKQITVGYLAQDLGSLDSYHPGDDKVGCDKDEDVKNSFSFFVWNDVKLKQDFTEKWEPIQKKHNSYLQELARKRVTVLGIPFGGEISLAEAKNIYNQHSIFITGKIKSVNDSGAAMRRIAEEHMGGDIPDAIMWTAITSIVDVTGITGVLKTIADEVMDDAVKNAILAHLNNIESLISCWNQFNIENKAKAIGAAEEINKKLSGWKVEINENLGKLAGIISAINNCPCATWPMEGYYDITFEE